MWSLIDGVLIVLPALSALGALLLARSFWVWRRLGPLFFAFAFFFLLLACAFLWLALGELLRWTPMTEYPWRPLVFRSIAAAAIWYLYYMLREHYRPRA